ncbi:hypothetical protein VNO77_46407 [Canavalia gladiata]|uniref:Uncharacterized protein n=1 Tax=Canavalia gladiata TaxID=3824 RepID=A0AAN9JIJ0_CANGL
MQQSCPPVETPNYVYVLISVGDPQADLPSYSVFLFLRVTLCYKCYGRTSWHKVHLRIRKRVQTRIVAVLSTDHSSGRIVQWKDSRTTTSGSPVQVDIRDISDSKPCPTPLASGSKLSAYDGAPLSYAREYRSIVGALQYLTLTRPDICYAVNQANPVFHARSKHIEVDYHFVRELVVAGKLLIRLDYPRSGEKTECIPMDSKGERRTEWRMEADRLERGLAGREVRFLFTRSIVPLFVQS